MALVIDLKPGERLLVGEAIITNDKQRTRLTIEGDAPILREKDILRAEDADTPCKQLYVMVQLMYVGRDPKPLQEAYFALARDIQDAAPSTTAMICAINENIIGGTYFKALKDAKRLIDYERELIANA